VSSFVFEIRETINKIKLHVIGSTVILVITGMEADKDVVPAIRVLIKTITLVAAVAALGMESAVRKADVALKGTFLSL
jgi:hypothetical protein